VLLQILEQTVAQSMAQDIFESYGRALQADAGIRLDQSVINAVHAQFP
jgi:peptidyl-prolyl cis-trans isomerase D